MLELGLLLLCHTAAPFAAPHTTARTQREDASDEAALVLRRYDLSGLRTNNSWNDENDWICVAPLLTDEWIESATEDPGYFVGDAMQWIVDSIGTDEFENPGRFIESVDRETLIVSASSEYHKAIEAKLALLRAANEADARIVVERHVVAKLPVGFEGGLVAIDAARQLVQSLGREHQASRHEYHASAFASRAFQGVAHASLLVDMDIEIATNGRAVDPVLAEVPIGPRGDLRAFPGGGGWHLRINLGDGRLESAREPASIPVRGSTETLDVADMAQFHANRALRVEHAGSDFFLPDGRAAVLVRSRSGGGAEVDVVYAVGGDSRITRDFSGTKAVHIGAALQSRTRFALRGSDGAVPSELALRNANRFGGPSFVVVRHSGRNVEEVSNWIGMALVRDDEYELQEWFWSIQGLASTDGPLLGQYVVDARTASSEPDLVPRLEAFVNAFAPQRRTLVARGRILSGDVELARFDVPIGADGSALVLDTVETPRVVDMDVEVASSAGMSDPIVEAIVDGYVVILSVTDQGDGRVGLTVEALWQSSDVATVETGVDIAPLVQSVAMHTHEMSGTASVQVAGDPARFGDLGQGGVRLEVALTGAN